MVASLARSFLIIELLEQFEPTKDFCGIARQFSTIVPAFKATTIVWEGNSWEGLLLTYAREPFDPALAVSLIRHVNATWDGELPTSGLLILPDFSHPEVSSDMNVVILLAPSHHGRFRRSNSEVHARTIVAIPALDNEFTGHETPEEFDDIIHTRADIGDWNRRRRVG